MAIEIPIVQLNTDVPMPKYANADDAGCDLYAIETHVLRSGGGRATIPTGIAVAIPQGYAGFILPRSGLAAKNGITVLNAPGLIDSGYRDELKVILTNTNRTAPYKVQKGDRIAQLVVQKIDQVQWNIVDSLEETERGLGGLGSSGV